MTSGTPATSGTAGGAEPAAAGRWRPGSRGLAVLLGLLGAGLVVLAGTRTWASAPVDGLRGATNVTATGRQAAPAAVAVALAAAAGALVLGTGGRAVRRAVAGLLVLAGAGVAALAIAVLADPGPAVAPSVARLTGLVTDPAAARAAAATGWPWLAVAGGVLVAAAGVVGLVRASRWAAPSRRFEPEPAAPGGPADDPGAGTAATWDALSRGEDPT